VSGSIIVSASRECLLAGVLIVNGPTRSTHTMNQGYSVRFCYFGWEQSIFLTLFLYSLIKSRKLLELRCGLLLCYLDFNISLVPFIFFNDASDHQLGVDIMQDNKPMTWPALAQDVEH
jgi:hypothetical protein